MATYAQLADLKAQLGITDTAEDAQLTNALNAASRAVEKWCGGRVFGLDVSATPRVYVPQSRFQVFIDDVGIMTGFQVEIGAASGVYTVLAASNYEARPTTGLVRGYPVTSIVDVNCTGIFWSTGLAPRVRVTAQWGWPSVPDEIFQATLLTAARLFRRKGSPEGVAGFGDLGVVRVTRVDPDVQALIAELVRVAVA